jgi:hypothetical protein
MAYSGKYKPNIKKYKGDPDKVTYRSHWEKLCFMWCDCNPEIKNWSSEEIVVPYYWDIDKRYHRYFIDLKITFNNGKTILVEIKPAKETEPPRNPNKSKRYIGEAMNYVKNMNKWEAANSFAKDRGWDFQIWTENTLKSMGIMKEQKGKLKPLKPLNHIVKNLKNRYK